MIVKLLAERGSAAGDLVVRSSLFTRSPNLQGSGRQTGELRIDIAEGAL
jgi:hypothetical protein